MEARLYACRAGARHAAGLLTQPEMPWNPWRNVPSASRIFTLETPEKGRQGRNFAIREKIVFDSGQDRETCYYRSRWFGLFSVPAPPFRFTASGGVFIFLAGLLLQSGFSTGPFPSCLP